MVDHAQEDVGSRYRYYLVPGTMFSMYKVGQHTIKACVKLETKETVFSNCYINSCL